MKINPYRFELYCGKQTKIVKQWWNEHNDYCFLIISERHKRGYNTRLIKVNVSQCCPDQ